MNMRSDDTRALMKADRQFRTAGDQRPAN